MIEMRQLFQNNQARPNINHYDATSLLAYAAASILLLITIYLTSMAPGTASDALVLMTVFP
jgi:hypothetical protein